MSLLQEACTRRGFLKLAVSPAIALAAGRLPGPSLGEEAGEEAKTYLTKTVDFPVQLARFHPLVGSSAHPETIDQRREIIQVTDPLSGEPLTFEAKLQLDQDDSGPRLIVRGSLSGGPDLAEWTLPVERVSKLVQLEQLTDCGVQIVTNGEIDVPLSVDGERVANPVDPEETVTARLQVVVLRAIGNNDVVILLTGGILAGVAPHGDPMPYFWYDHVQASSSCPAASGQEGVLRSGYSSPDGPSGGYVIVHSSYVAP